MQKTHLAVCDLGTNMWRLRIVDKRLFAQKFAETADHRLALKTALESSFLLRESVFMAREGGARIGEASLLRCKTALQKFKLEIDKYAVSHVWIAATAGFRKAENATELVAWAQTELGLTIEIISGDREAELLGKGIRAAMPPLAATDTALMIDVGGGSIEYMIGDAQHSLWAKSYPIGVSALYEKFANTHALGQPFSASECANIMAFLKKILVEIPNLLEKYHVTKLAMTSGTFGVLYNFLKVKKAVNQTFNLLKTLDFERLYAEILLLSHTDLYASPDVPDNRVELLHVSLFPIKHAISILPVSEIIVPHWSMEEGMVLTLLEQE